MATYASLPMESLCDVLQFLPVSDIVGSVRRTCRRLRDASKSEMLWCFLLRSRGICNVTPLPDSSWSDLAKCLSFTQKGEPLTGAWRTLVSASGGELVTCQTTIDALRSSPSAVHSLSGRFVANRVIGIIPVMPSEALLCSAQKWLYMQGGIAGNTANVVAPLLNRDSQGIDMFDLFPCDALGARTVALHMYSGMAAWKSNPEVAAKLLFTMMHCCSTIVLLGERGRDVKEWISAVEQRLSHAAVTESQAYCTPSNTPNAFVVVQDGDCDSVLQALRRPRSQLAEWLCANCNEAKVVPSMEEAKCTNTYRIPGWINPLSTFPLSPLVTSQIVAACATGAAASMWTTEQTMASSFAPLVERAAAFYCSAMTTEMEDCCKPLLEGKTQMQHPIEAAELADLHDHFFFAALRSCAMQLGDICGTDVAAGVTLLESLKQLLTSTFRQMWRKNLDVSRDYCTCVFHEVFAPVRTRFINGDGFHEKKGLKRWYAAVCDKFSEYQLKAKGPRKFDVLWDLITLEVIPEVQQWSMDRPTHAYFRPSDVTQACLCLRQYTEELLTGFRRSQDEQLSQRQRSSAVYTSYVGCEWTAAAHSTAATTLRGMRVAASTWQHNCAVKSGMFGQDVNTEAMMHAMDSVRQGIIMNHVSEESSLRTRSAALAAQLEGTKRELCVVGHERLDNKGKFTKWVERLRQRFS